MDSSDKQFFESICDEMRSEGGKLSVLDNLLEGSREGDITVSCGGELWIPASFSRINEAFRLSLVENPDRIADKFLRQDIGEYWLWIADARGIIYGSSKTLRSATDTSHPHHGKLLRAWSQYKDGHPKTYEEIGKYRGNFNWDLSGIYMPRQTVNGTDSEASWISAWSSKCRRVLPLIIAMADKVGAKKPLMLEINKRPSASGRYEPSIETLSE